VGVGGGTNLTITGQSMLSDFLYIKGLPVSSYAEHSNKAVNFFNIVCTMHDAKIKFIKPTLHALKSDHKRFAVSNMFQHFLGAETCRRLSISCVHISVHERLV
jgi:hypothetical protein